MSWCDPMTRGTMESVRMPNLGSRGTRLGRYVIGVIAA